MTHEELLAEVNKNANWDDGDSSNALRAVMELHKPIQDDWFGTDGMICKECSREEYTVIYPCPTIQAIEKELK